MAPIPMPSDRLDSRWESRAGRTRLKKSKARGIAFLVKSSSNLFPDPPSVVFVGHGHLSIFGWHLTGGVSILCHPLVLFVFSCFTGSWKSSVVINLDQVR